MYLKIVGSASDAKKILNKKTIDPVTRSPIKTVAECLADFIRQYVSESSVTCSIDDLIARIKNHTLLIEDAEVVE